MDAMLLQWTYRGLWQSWISSALSIATADEGPPLVPASARWLAEVVFYCASPAVQMYEQPALCVHVRGMEGVE